MLFLFRDGLTFLSTAPHPTPPSRHLCIKCLTLWFLKMGSLLINEHLLFIGHGTGTYGKAVKLTTHFHLLPSFGSHRVFLHALYVP